MKKEINLKNKYFIIFVFIFVVALGIYFFKANLSGNAVLELDADYFEGENLEGILKLSLNNGEFIPASSMVIFETSEKQYEFALEDVLSEQPIEGIYYIQGQNLSGKGLGYGSIGIKKVYSDISFEFNIYSESDKTENEENRTENSEVTNGTEVVKIINETNDAGEINESEKQVEEVNEENRTENSEVTNGTEVVKIINETNDAGEINESEKQVEEVNEENRIEISETSDEIETGIIEVGSEDITEDVEDELVEAPLESEEVIEEEVIEKAEVAEEPTITGGVISSIFKNFLSFFQFIPTGKVSLSFETTVSGETSADKSFIYNLEKGQTAELVSGSVRSYSKELSDGDIQFEVLDDKIIVSTNYFELEQGFGANYLDNELQIFEINLSAIGLNFTKGDLNVKFVYGEKDIISLSTTLQEGKIEERNELALIEISEFALQNLTDDERQVLIQKFGNVSIKTTMSKVLDGRLIRNYKIGDYELVASYDYDLNKIDSLKEQMEIDKLNFLRDLINMISEEENESENVVEFFGNSDF